MNKQSIAARIAAACGLAAVLAGCGGGSSSPAPTPANTVTVGVQGSSYAAVGQTVQVTWSNSQGVACTGSGALAGNLGASGTQAAALTAEGGETFTVTCGNASQSATITVLPKYTKIRDAVFEQALVALGVDDQVDGQVLTTNILQVRKLAIIGGSMYQMAADVQAATTGSAFITDATGLENFRNLTWLRFDNQKVASFDLSNMTGLTWLSLWQEPITSIDLSHNAALQTLGLSETSLTDVDLSSLAALTDLEIQQDDSQLGAVYTTGNGTFVAGFASLDVSHNPKLTSLLAFGNHLRTLDLSHNPALTNASFSYNQLTSVYLGSLPVFDSLVIDHNQLAHLDIAGTKIGQVTGPQGLVTTGNPALTEITVTNANQMAAWCTAAEAAWLAGNATNGQCAIDTGTVFVSGT